MCMYQCVATLPTMFCLSILCATSLVTQTSRFPLEDVVPLPALKTQCGQGYGLAVCPALGLVVTSSCEWTVNTLSVWSLPDCAGGGGGASGGPGASAEAGSSSGGGLAGGGGGGLRPVCTLGGAAPMQLRFLDGKGGSGYLAFTPPAAASASDGSSAHPLLLVTDAGHDAVHVVDVVGGSHAGYVAAPGSIAGPRGVAASGTSPLVAVSAWKGHDGGDHVVVVYRGSGAVWEAVRVIGGGFGGPGDRDGQLAEPYGLRFSGDGTAVCVADHSNNRVSMFRVGDGGFVKHIATGLSWPLDVEEVEGGWLVAGGGHRVEFVGIGFDDVGGGRPLLGKACHGSGDVEFRYPSALAVVPGLGLVVREDSNGRLQVFVNSATVAMAAMSCMRVAWMVAMVRAVLRPSHTT
jgi:hypothetical protein